MTLKQKTSVWLAALNAVKHERFGVRMLVASGVAQALGLCCLFSVATGFELRRTGRGGGPFPGRLLHQTHPEFVTDK